MTEPGKLTHRITFRSRTVSTLNGVRRDDYTDMTPDRVPALVETPFASRVSRLFGDRDTATLSHIITTRFRSGIKPKDGVTWHTADGDITLVVSALQVTEGGRFLVLAVSEVA